MSPPHTALDPEGYYARLGLEPGAEQASIASAYRSQARVLHPDVPITGDAAAFVAVKQAYDVLSNPERRAAYDEAARKQAAIRATVAAMQAQAAALRPIMTPSPLRTPPPSAVRVERLKLGAPSVQMVMMWLGLCGFLAICVTEVVLHLRQPAPEARSVIRPNAATVAPLSADAHNAVLYGPSPVQLPGTPNFYVIPAASPATLWRKDAERNVLTPAGRLPPFSMVQGLRLFRQNGMVEVVGPNDTTLFVDVGHLSPGNADMAHRAYCTYNAGPAPSDGEMLERHGSGSGTLEVENHAVQPAVVKLRDPTGSVAVSVFLGPGGHVALHGLPVGSFQADFAIGEIWSRACHGFAGGMRARRFDDEVVIAGSANLEVWSDSGGSRSTDISDQMFEHE